MTVVIFFLCLLGWLGTLFLLYQQQSLTRLFMMMMMSVWLYMSIELMMWAAGLPLISMMTMGLLPIFFVLVGFRVYDRMREREKRKNDEKIKNDDLVNA